MAGDVPMAGDWALSMAWMRMPGQTRLAAGAAFLGVWLVMMVAMMLPSLVPVLSRYRGAVREGDAVRLGGVTALAGAGYFAVWALYGAAAYPLAVLVTAAELRWSAVARLVPVSTGAVFLVAGSYQLTVWKTRQLARCWDALACGAAERPDARRAWQHGLRLGVRCSLCCCGFMVLLLATGFMRLAAMALAAAAITLERVAPQPERVARAVGVVLLAVGALVIARALGVA